MSYHILLVDDDKTFRDEFRDALDDYEVIEASSGQEAIDILKKPNDLDLVILDVMMPGMKGTEVLKGMKRIAPNLAIIIITGFSSTHVAVEALKGHADDYIEKPIDIIKTKTIIANILKSKDDGDGIDSMNIKGKVGRTKLFAERNFHKKVTLDDAAKTVGLSPKYLSRIFKEETGVGFSEFRIEIKVQKAKEMLKNTGYNVNQISDRLGYENAESFIRVFRKSAGCTPSEYRKKKTIPNQLR